MSRNEAVNTSSEKSVADLGLISDPSDKNEIKTTDTEMDAGKNAPSQESEKLISMDESDDDSSNSLSGEVLSSKSVKKEDGDSASSSSSSSGSAEKQDEEKMEVDKPQQNIDKKKLKKAKSINESSENEDEDEYEEESDESETSSEDESDDESSEEEKASKPVKRKKVSDKIKSAENKGRVCARLGHPCPPRDDKRFKNKSEEYIDAFFAAYERIAKKHTKTDSEIADAKSRGRNLAYQGYPRPEPDDQRLFLGKSAAYVEAYIRSYDKAAKNIAGKKDPDAIMGLANGKRCAKRTNDRPDQNDKRFNGRSEVYKKAFFEGFDKQKSKSTLSDAELGAQKGHDAARNAIQRPSLTAKVFKDKSEAFIKSYLKSYDETIIKMKIDPEVLAAKIYGRRSVQKGSKCPDPSDPRFAGKSSKFVETYIKSHKELSDTIEMDSDLAAAEAKGKNVAYLGHKRPTEDDKRFENKSAEYKKAYLGGFDKIRAGMKDPDISLAYTNGAQACRAGGKRPSRDDKRFAGKSDPHIDAYLAGHDSTKPAVKDEAKAEAARGRQNGLDAAKFSTKAITAQDKRFQGQSKHYTKAYLDAYAEAQQKGIAQPDITNGRRVGRKLAASGKPRPSETDKRFDGKSEEYKKAFFAGYDAAIAKGVSVTEISRARQNGQDTARNGSARPKRNDSRFKGKSKEYIDAYLQGYDDKAAKMRAKGEIGRVTKKPLPEPEEEKSNSSRKKSAAGKKPASIKKAVSKKADSVKPKSELKKASAEKNSSSKDSGKETIAPVPTAKQQLVAKAPAAVPSTVRKIPKKVPSQKSSISTSKPVSTSTSTSTSTSSKNKTLVKPNVAKPSGTLNKAMHQQIKAPARPSSVATSLQSSGQQDAKDHDSRKRKRDEIPIKQKEITVAKTDEKTDEKSVAEITERPQKQAKISDKTSTAEAGLSLAVNVGSDSAASVAVANSVPVIVSESGATDTDTAPIPVATSSSALPTAPADSRKRKHEQMAETEKLIEMDESDDHLDSAKLSQGKSLVPEEGPPSKQARKENGTSSEAVVVSEQELPSKQTKNGDSASRSALIGLWQRNSIAGTGGSGRSSSENEERDEKKRENQIG